jgi:plasmid maintenance system antidote protein VapI
MLRSTSNRYLVETARIKAVIDARGLKPKWIAEQLGIHPTRLSQFVNGLDQFPCELAAPLAAILGVSESFILDCFYLK